jgi:hypothetical protein
VSQASAIAAPQGRSSGWLPLLPLERDDSTWTYRRSDLAHVFPVSVTGVLARVLKSEEDLQWIEAWREVWEPRGNTCHAALQRFALHRWGAPAHLWPKGRRLAAGVDPQRRPWRQYGAWIAPLLAEPLWEHVEVIGAEVMLCDMERNVAGTFDLVLRFPDGTCGVADLKTLSARGKPYPTRPQLGAGALMLAAHHGLELSRCLTLWASPGSCQVQTFRAEDCIGRWLDVFARYEAQWRPF